jgi:GT2 family glycosyltransferase
MEELARHPEADLCYTAYRMLIRVGDTTCFGRASKVPAAKNIRRSLFKDVTFIPSSVLIRRSTMLAENGFNPRMRYGNEDYDMWLRLLHSGVKFAACREPLFQYRRHDGNTSTNMGWLDECMEIYRRLALPYLPRFTGWITYFKFLSEHEGGAAYTLRQQGNPAHLAMMARSVLHWPFNDSHRYKVLIHMLYARLRKTFQQASIGSAR